MPGILKFQKCNFSLGWKVRAEIWDFHTRRPLCSDCDHGNHPCLVIRAFLVDPFAGQLRSKHDHFPSSLPHGAFSLHPNNCFWVICLKRREPSWLIHQLGCLWDAQTLQHVNTYLVLLLDTSSGLFQPFPGGCFWEQGKDVHLGPSLGARNIRCEPPFPPPTSCSPFLWGCTPGHSGSGLNEQLAKKMDRFCYFFSPFLPSPEAPGLQLMTQS